MEYQLHIKLDFEQLLYLAMQLSEPDKERLVGALTPIHNTDALYEGLSLDSNMQVMQYDTLPQQTDFSAMPNAAGLSQTLASCGGAWEEDEAESIEMLLNALKL